VIYTGFMAIRVGLVVVPILAVIGLVLLLNGLDAPPGIAAASLGAVAVASGGALGYFADRLPDLRRPSRPSPPA
jgi:hypothetical protein